MTGPRIDHESVGAIFGRIRGVDVARHYGDPAAAYAEAVDSVAVRDRSHRTRLLVTGRAPVSTLSGVLTGRMPVAPAGAAPAGTEVDPAGPRETGHAEYSAVLSAKGRVIADLRVMWGPDAAEESLWLDVPAPAAQALLEHLKRYVPPRLAAVEDVTADSGLLTVMGPEASVVLAEMLFDDEAVAEALVDLEEGEYIVGGRGGERLVRTGEVDTPAWDVFSSGEGARRLWEGMLERGVAAVGAGVWDTLRVEAGRPAFGQDMDESRLLPEVGIVDRAVDHNKGCYTGQEVVVRIRDRGHVNRELRGLRLGDGPAPAVEAELFYEGDAAGVVTNAVESPRSGPIALAYVRREVPEGGHVAVGRSDGPEATVHQLTSGWARS